MISKIDFLSEEIFFTIFEYLTCVDILDAFLHISPYIDGIVFRYENYHVNFRCILKRNFDLICRCIQPNQIKSLIVSDSRQTPGQSNIYLSRFPIEQFIHLQAISLFEIEDENRSLFRNINQLNNLVSFQTDRLANFELIETLPRLKRLVLTQFSDIDYNHVNLLDLISYSHLRSLTLPYCSYPQLRRILSEASQLRKLNISLIISDCTGVDYFAEQHHNTTLRITHLTMSIGTFSKLKNLLQNILILLLLFFRSSNISSSFRTISLAYEISSISRIARYFRWECQSPRRKSMGIISSRTSSITLSIQFQISIDAN